MKVALCGLLILWVVIFSFADDNVLKTFRFGVGLSPSFSYLLVSSSSQGSQAWFSNYLGGLSVEARLGYSKSEIKGSRFVSSITWDYPSSHFAYSLFEGYALTFSKNESMPTRVFDFSAGLYSSHVAGLDHIYGAWGLKTGFRTGYEIKNRLFFWIGGSIGFQLRSYSYQGTMISEDGTYQALFNGTQHSSDLIFPTSIFASLTYSIF